jgi:putative addiction module component (TIGR02574 family)
MNAQFDEWFRLGVSERLALVEDLWDSIADHPEELPVPAWQIEELARRKAAHLQDPAAGSSWEEVKERITNRHARNPDHPA